MTANEVKAELDALANDDDAAQLASFFKTGPGQYGEGDRFIGVRMPAQRHVAKRHADLSLTDIEALLHSSFHEHRQTGLLILGEQFARSADFSIRREIVEYYLSNLDRVNNWDLVDLSAPKILGQHLMRHPGERDILFRLARSSGLWERRVAVLSTWPLIKAGQFHELLVLAESLLTDSEDLIHKAVGWMLREAGKVDDAVLEEFLEKHARAMPRTMLRYAIERLSPARRRLLMKNSRSKTSS